MNNTSEQFRQAPRLINEKPDKMLHFEQGERLVKTIARRELTGNTYKYFDVLLGTAGVLHPSFFISQAWMEKQTGIAAPHQTRCRKELVAKGFISHSDEEFIQIEYYNILMVYGEQYYKDACYTEDEFKATVYAYRRLHKNIVMFKKSGDEDYSELNPYSNRQNMYRPATTCYQNGSYQNGSYNIESLNIEKTLDVPVSDEDRSDVAESTDNICPSESESDSPVNCPDREECSSLGDVATETDGLPFSKWMDTTNDGKQDRVHQVTALAHMEEVTHVA